MCNDACPKMHVLQKTLISNTFVLHFYACETKREFGHMLTTINYISEIQGQILSIFNLALEVGWKIYFLDITYSLYHL